MTKELLLQNEPLKRFWERCTQPDNLHEAPPSATAWNEQVYQLAVCGRAIEESLKYLYSKRPAYDDFADWLLLTYKPQELPASHQPVLTAEDRDFWDANGYIVIKNAVSADECEAVREAIWEYLYASPSIPQSWYEEHSGKKGMMLSFFQHPALTANRNNAKIRKVYEELYDSRDIYLPIDKVGFNPPETPLAPFAGSGLHWDVSLHLPIPYVLQGLVYLTDTGTEDGAFHCVPGFHKRIDEWLEAMPEGVDPRRVAPYRLNAVPVAGNAGDLVIWHQALPHCATPNKGKHPRMVQYIAYKPVDMPVSEIWK